MMLRSALHTARVGTVGAEPATTATPPPRPETFAGMTGEQWLTVALLGGGFYLLLTSSSGSSAPAAYVRLQGSDRQMQRVEGWLEREGYAPGDTGTDLRSGKRDVELPFHSREEAAAAATRIRRRFRGKRVRVRIQVDGTEEGVPQ